MKRTGKGKKFPGSPRQAHRRELDEGRARRGLNPNMLIEFVDGSKTIIEMAAVSNATGLIPDVRGMHGPETDRDHLHETFTLKEHDGVLNKTGIVDFGVGSVAGNQRGFPKW